MIVCHCHGIGAREQFSMHGGIWHRRKSGQGSMWPVGVSGSVQKATSPQGDKLPRKASSQGSKWPRGASGPGGQVTQGGK